MLKAYKIVISLVTIMHLIGAGMAIFLPENMVTHWGFEFDENLSWVSIHFGLVLMLFSSFLGLAAVWTFKGKIEGIQLGLVGGIGLLVSSIIEIIIYGQDVDISHPITGILTTVIAYLALRSKLSQKV